MSRAIDRLRQIAAAWHRATSVDSAMLPVHICDLDAAVAAADAQRERADDAAHSAEHWQESHDLELARAAAAEAECARLTTERDAARAEAAGLRAAIAAERAVRAAWLATLPACATAPADVVAAEAATGAALAGAVRAYLAAVDAHRAEKTRWQREYIPAEGVQRARIAEALAVVGTKRTALDAALAAATTTPTEGHG